MDKKVPKEAAKLAGRDFDVSDYGKNGQLSSGLAHIHEQVSDAYKEGEINPVIEDVNGNNQAIPRDGYAE
jgi:hypothetical protein